MKKTVCNKDPLLLQGFRMSKTAANVAAGQVVTGYATIQQQRGNVKYLDVMSMIAPGATGNIGSLISIDTGGNILLQNIPASMYNPNAYSKYYNLTCVDIEEGQTVNWTFDNSASANANNACMHLYYENPYLLDADFLSKFDEKARGLKERVYSFTAAAASKVQGTGKLQLPSDQGNIIGFQIFAENVAGTKADVYNAFITVLINGTQVVEDACLGIGYAETSRPYMRFPIFCEKSGTFELQVDNGDSATANRYGIKFFFDQD